VCNVNVRESSRGKPAEAVMFGEALRRFRVERGWSQERLAGEAGVTLNYIGNLERGEQGPSLYVLIKIARALQIDLPTLLEDFRGESLRRLRLAMK
jgi:transcriptional regulator with XRE-family HTH domain